MQDLFLKFARQHIPEEILHSFEVDSIDDSSPTELIISLIEKEDLIPVSENELEPKGFLKEIEVTHFPTKGHVCYLRLKRRKWKMKNQLNNPKTFYNVYDFYKANAY